jgi:hypothetical protein
MTIKDDELYPKYLIWLDDRKMSNGLKELSKMSQSLFEEFKSRYKLNPSLKEKIDNKYKSIDRQEKIEDIVKDDFELFLEEMDLPSEPPPFYEDNLFDF